MCINQQGANGVHLRSYNEGRPHQGWDTGHHGRYSRVGRHWQVRQNILREQSWLGKSRRGGAFGMQM